MDADKGWQEIADDIHLILCSKADGTRIGSSAPSEPGPPCPPDTKMGFIKQKAVDLKNIIQTQGVRAGAKVCINFFITRVARDRDAGKNLYAVPEAAEDVLVFPKSESPDVSIIIPVYNNWGYTYNCLKSILSNGCTCTYEVIIADDCSTDKTVDLEKYVENVIHVRNEVNLNFLRNCNRASEYAKGKYILLLNNDTLVREGWLQSLFDLIESDPTIGLVGSKFIYPDGTLQEAGGMVFPDGTGKNYGRGDDPSKPQYNFVRDVDYISGASIMLPRALWEDLGRFDERYTPAYFEDSDLAFKVRKAGYRVVYQPKSELVHFERTTMSDNGLKLMAANKVKFLEVWEKDLVRDSAPEYIQRDRGKFRKSILYVDDKVPMFDQHAGGKTTFNFLQVLRDMDYRVTFMSVFDSVPYQPYTDILTQMGIEVLSGPEFSGDGLWIWLNRYAKYYDIVFLNRPECAIIYLDWFRKNTDSQIAYYGHDLHWLREMREYELTGDEALLERSRKSKETEMYIMSRSDIVMSVSPDEKEIIDRELGADKTFVTPIFFYKEKERKPFSSLRKDGLLFVGGYNHTPNIDAVKWFVEEVLPIVRRSYPDVDVTLAGSHPTDWVRSLESEHIHVPGYMSDADLDEVYDRSLVSIAPLRFGAGVKGKVVDAMHHGLPVVSTSIGTEGLPGIGSCITARDDAESFAAGIVELLGNPDMVEEAYERNYRYVLDTFGYDAAVKTFEGIFGTSDRNSRGGDNTVSVLDLAYSVECPATAGGSLRIVSPFTRMGPRSKISVDLVFTAGNGDYSDRIVECLSKIPVVRRARAVKLSDYLSKPSNRPGDIPGDVWETMSKEFSDYVDTLVRQNHYDIIQLEHTQFAWLVPRLRVASPSSRIVLDAHNVEYRVYESWLPYADAGSRAAVEENCRLMKNWEERCVPWFDAAICVSSLEEKMLRDMGVRNTYLVATGGGIDPAKYAPQDDGMGRPYDLLYVGSMNWFPNAHGLIWFMDKVMPIIQRKRPGTMLHIVGNGTPDRNLVRRSKSDSHVKFWGFQKDDVSFFHKGKVFIVPLFIGAGARVKIPTAWASKIPVVSTVFGAEGLAAVDGENIFMKDDPAEFAEAVLSILESPALGEEIASNAFSTLQDRYTVDKCAEGIVSAYHDIAGF